MIAYLSDTRNAVKALEILFSGAAIGLIRVPRSLQVTGDLLIVLLLVKCSRRIHAIVSTSRIPDHLLHSKEAAQQQSL